MRHHSPPTVAPWPWPENALNSRISSKFLSFGAVGESRRRPARGRDRDDGFGGSKGNGDSERSTVEPPAML